MRHFSTPCSRPASAARWLLALTAGLLAAGCVTRGTHREVVTERDALRTERDRLATRVERLSASNKSLDAERARLLDGIEDLRQEESSLRGDLQKLRKSEDLLSRHLREREAQLTKMNQLRSTYEALVADMEAELAEGQIEIEQLREGLRLNLTQDILFASGSATLNDEGRRLIEKVAERLKGVPNKVEVQGHSDNIPISQRLAARFPTNWELAAARASQVVRVLAESGLAPDRLVAASYGPFHPVESNATPQGRAKNRRIEIRLEPMPDTPRADAATRGTAQR